MTRSIHLSFATRHSCRHFEPSRSWMRNFSFVLLVILMAALLPPTCSAQVATGTPAFSSFAGGPDVVNLGNLNSHIPIPVFHRAGRGDLNFSYDLGYDSAVWYPVGASGSQSWNPVQNFGWLGQTQILTGYISYSASFTQRACYSGGQVLFTSWWLYQNWSYFEPFGASHGFSGGTQVFTSTDCGQSPIIFANGQYLTASATDNSGYTLNANGGSGIITTPANATFAPPAQSTTGAGSVTDRNGNQMNVNSSGVFTDTLGTTALTVTGSGTPASPMKFTYTAPNGSSVAVQINYTQYTVATNFGVSGISEYGRNSQALPSSIVLPDGSSYSITYEPTPSVPSAGACTPLSGTTSCVTARVASITLPTGGTISYTYTGGNNGILSDGTAATLTRTAPDGTWTYARSQVSGTHWQTLISDPTTPTANQTLMDFQKDAGATANYYEVQRQVFQGSTSGTLLQTITICYNGAASPCTGTTVTSPINRRTEIIQYPNSVGVQCEHDTFFNANGLVTEVDDYAYGSGGIGSLMRKTLTSYSTGVVGMPATVTVQDASGATIAQTTYTYDQTTPTAPIGTTPQHIAVSGARGNATTISYLTQGSSTISKTFTYWDTGMVKTATDVNNGQTTYNYPDANSTCGNAFPTSITEAISGLSTSATWNCTGGVQLTAVDENAKTTTTAYTDVFFWRPASVTDPTGAVTNFSYATSSPYNWTESYINFNGSNSTVDVRTTVDGLGRTRFQQKKQGPSATTYDIVETDYDSSGRVNRVTLPYSGTLGQTCPPGPSCPATTTTYDALTRVSQVTDAGTGSLSYTYPLNDVYLSAGPAPANENTKRRQLEYNALGQLTSVCEITTASGSGSCAQSSAQTGFWTKYTYDVLGNLTGVTQNAQAAAGQQQTRNYAFDGLSRLTSETNAESGTTSYTYDADTTCGTSSGDLVKRVDAAGNVTCKVYDPLHRVTSITYPSGPNASLTTMKVFYYDTSHFNTTSNTKGRLASAGTCQNPTCAGPWITAEDFSYSARGELTDVFELTPNSGGWYHVTQSYWPHGAPSQLSNLAGLPTISYGGTSGLGLDGEGRITQATASSGQNPVTGVTFNTSSLPTQVNFGSGDSDIFAYDSNTLRMTQFKFNVGTQSQYLNGALTWNANSTLRQLAITDQFNGANSQTCNYSHDDLTRIATANCGAAANQTFSYDAFGNISKSGSPYSFQPTYNPATNRFATIPGITPTYDGNGNVTYDGSHNYAWDADGNSVTVDSVGLTFDALDRMVEQNRSGSYTQIVYSPTGGKLALMNGQTLQKAFVPVPGQATAVYTSSGLDHYRHSDWLGSARLTSSPSRSYISSVAYAPFGESYAASGSTDPSFTGMTPDTASSDYDFLYREYSTQGRWPSPDPAGLAAVNPANPQSWNRYAYVWNNPLAFIDPLGLNCASTNPYVTTVLPSEDNCAGIPSPNEVPPNPATEGCSAYYQYCVRLPSGNWIAVHSPADAYYFYLTSEGGEDFWFREGITCIPRADLNFLQRAQLKVAQATAKLVGGTAGYGVGLDAGFGWGPKTKKWNIGAGTSMSTLIVADTSGNAGILNSLSGGVSFPFMKTSGKTYGGGIGAGPTLLLSPFLIDKIKGRSGSFSAGGGIGAIGGGFSATTSGAFTLTLGTGAGAEFTYAPQYGNGWFFPFCSN